MYGAGVVWSDGKEGGYLVVGNFIYTVRKFKYKFDHDMPYLDNDEFLIHCFFYFIWKVCSRCRELEEWTGNKVLDYIYTPFYLGLNYILVHIPPCL